MTGLWEAERRKLRNQLRASSFSPDEAEDIITEAFLRVQRRYGDEATPALLWQVAFNAAVDLQRDESKQTRVKGLCGRDAEILNGVAITSIETAMLRADFLRAFRLLPRTQQEAFALTEMRGLSADEASAVLDVPQRTVNWRREAARTFLREELSGIR